MVLEYLMRLRKKTKYKACFKENMSRIGRIYLPIPLLNILSIDDEIIIQLAPDKSLLPSGGYKAQLIRDKETVKTMRFVEGIEEKGELGIIYISKDILEHMGIEETIAVRIVSAENNWGGVAVDQG